MRTTEYVFDVTLTASITVAAATQAEADAKLREAIATTSAGIMTLDGRSVAFGLTIEGELDCDLVVTTESGCDCWTHSDGVMAA
jgi:hypothetical protein